VALEGRLVKWVGRLALTVDFLEGELLCFADEAEDHAPGDKVQAGVEADC